MIIVSKAALPLEIGQKIVFEDEDKLKKDKQILLVAIGFVTI